jgi:hypothetical protein
MKCVGCEKKFRHNVNGRYADYKLRLTPLCYFCDCGDLYVDYCNGKGWERFTGKCF